MKTTIETNAPLNDYEVQLQVQETQKLVSYLRLEALNAAAALSRARKHQLFSNVEGTYIYPAEDMEFVVWEIGNTVPVMIVPARGAA